MNFITQKHLHRRTVLKGLGATIALPFLDAMVPVRAAAQTRKLRLVAMEMVHGSAGAHRVRRHQESVGAGRDRLGVRPQPDGDVAARALA